MSKTALAVAVDELEQRAELYRELATKLREVDAIDYNPPKRAPQSPRVKEARIAEPEAERDEARKALAATRADEREACAKVADEYADWVVGTDGDGIAYARARYIAAAIRARGEEGHA
jgi:hypothetical protein